ncbi:MAG: hypothetical protein A3D92_11140 [Bacteroidetes bacterium RIFCSPHIGHO2_02_FULL_44_7]|nr:MAG: hypothetical protein A3D92_11140 [Bacteroidetes bacterium RIFCSPHIGHO2_02_FULL_44_7]
MLNQEEIARYSRHLRLLSVGTEGQEKLKAARVLVIGAGGLGCPVLQYLCAAGVGTIGIVDDDRVDVSNLQRQVLYSEDDIGRRKVDCAMEHLSRQNPHVLFESHALRLDRNNALGLCAKYDILIDGTDNFPTRYLVGDVSVLLNKPLVFGSIFKFEGQVAVFNYQGGPSYRCLYPTPPAPGQVPNCSEIGVLGVLPGFIGTRMAAECLKMILGIGEVLSGKLLMTDLLGNSERILKIRKQEENWNRTALDLDYAGFCGIVEQIAPDGISALTLSEWIEANKAVQLIDVRESYELELCMIPGSHWIPLGEIAERSDEIDPDRPKVMICHHGMRSAMAIEILKSKGCSQLVNLEGGIHAWATTVDPEMQQY